MRHHDTGPDNATIRFLARHCDQTLRDPTTLDNATKHYRTKQDLTLRLDIIGLNVTLRQHVTLLYGT
jgi:hypothetical protein